MLGLFIVCGCGLVCSLSALKGGVCRLATTKPEQAQFSIDSWAEPTEAHQENKKWEQSLLMLQRNNKLQLQQQEHSPINLNTV